MKTVAITDFLTEEQIRSAFWCHALGGVKAIQKQVIEPNLAEINRKLGQENHPAYLAYAVEYSLGRMGQLALQNEEHSDA